MNALGPFPTEDFRTFLLAEFSRRSASRRQYSLRRFARFLEIEPSILSKILRGKVAITESRIKKLAPRLGLSEADCQRYIDAARIARGQGTSGDIFKMPVDYKMSVLPMSQFLAVADWYHFAILELTQMDQFRGEIDWIASRLNISNSDVAGAIDRMQKLGLLEITEDGIWLDRSGNVTTVGNDPATDEALRLRQKAILEKATVALDMISPEERDQATVIFAVDAALVPEIKLRLQAFRRSLAELIQSRSQVKDSVYILTNSLFPASVSTGERDASE